MKIIDSISISELQEMAKRMYGSIVKADVDVAKKIVLVDMEMHADGEAYLLENGSQNKDLWGINFHPDKFGTDEFVEFDSMINIRPSQNNFSKSIDDEQIRNTILEIVDEVVHE